MPVRRKHCQPAAGCSGNQKTVHFGLGEAMTVAKLDVIWPSGTRQELRNLEADRLVTVKEPER
jgi:hypothetical protein